LLRPVNSSKDRHGLSFDHLIGTNRGRAPFNGRR